MESMSGEIRSYRDLKVWQKAIELVPRIYELIRSLPREETYALADQIRRAVVSIAANIAEGQARQHTKEFRQSLYVARGSLAELDTLLEVAIRLRYLTPEQKTQLEPPMSEVRRMLDGLIKAL